MQAHRKKRLQLILVLIIGISAALALALMALKQNIDLYFTPTQVLQHSISLRQIFRLGGVVKKGSVLHHPKSLQMQFVLTDFHHQMTVYYEGMLPALFREGQGVVAQGQLNAKGEFFADQILAKHDANYHPPNVVRPQS